MSLPLVRFGSTTTSGSRQQEEWDGLHSTACQSTRVAGLAQAIRAIHAAEEAPSGISPELSVFELEPSELLVRRPGFRVNRVETARNRAVIAALAPLTPKPTKICIFCNPLRWLVRICA
jgi:hypothetical protein